MKEGEILACFAKQVSKKQRWILAFTSSATYFAAILLKDLILERKQFWPDIARSPLFIVIFAVMYYGMNLFGWNHQIELTNKEVRSFKWRKHVQPVSEIDELIIEGGAEATRVIRFKNYDVFTYPKTWTNSEAMDARLCELIGLRFRNLVTNEYVDMAALTSTRS